MERIDAERDPARGPDRLARLVRADQRRPRPRERPRRSAAASPPRTPTRASATGSSSTPAARTRSTPTSCRSRARAAPARSTALLGTMPKAMLANLAADTATARSPTTPAARPAPLPTALAARPLSRARPRAPRLPAPPHRPRGGRRRQLRPLPQDALRLRATTATSTAGRGRSAPARDARRSVTGSGGEVSPRLYDLDGDNALDVIQATSSGELYVLRRRRHAARRASTAASRCAPTATRSSSRRAGAGRASTPRASRCGCRRSATSTATASRRSSPPRASTSTPGTRDGERRRRLPGPDRPGALRALRRPACRKPCFDAADRAITSDNHIKRGFFGSPALADLDGDGGLDIVAGALDQHVYAWDGDGRRRCPASRSKLADRRRRRRRDRHLAGDRRARRRRRRPRS